MQSINWDTPRIIAAEFKTDDLAVKVSRVPFSAYGHCFNVDPGKPAGNGEPFGLIDGPIEGAEDWWNTAAGGDLIEFGLPITPPADPVEDLVLVEFDQGLEVAAFIVGAEAEAGFHMHGLGPTFSIIGQSGHSTVGQWRALFVSQQPTLPGFPGGEERPPVRAALIYAVARKADGTYPVAWTEPAPNILILGRLYYRKAQE